MSKAVISNKIYMNVNKEQLKDLATKLTYRIEVIRDKSGRFNTVEILRNYSIPSPGVIAIPQGRLDLVPIDYEIIDKRTIIPVEMPTPLLQLRPGQQLVHDAWEGTGILNALVGWGKTYTALWIAYTLGQKTLIVAHNTMLRDQWTKDIKCLFGFNPGVVGSGEFNINSPIVVGNVQTLTKHATALADCFGTIILDEMHHCPATTFSAIIGASKARYRIGLSGTMERKDGKHVVFRDFFGDHIHKPPQSNTMNPTIKIIKSGKKLNSDLAWAKKINDLTEDRDYLEFIVGVAKSQIAKGHKVLIVADRVGFLTTIARLIGDDCVLVTGQSASFEDRERAKRDIESGAKKAIAGSRQIFAEGISINPLSCLILTCPISSPILLEQLIGRVMREYPGKLDPIVCDINFAGRADQKLNNSRRDFYLAKGWEIQII